MNILVSVIITTKNEEKHIENCLKSIKSQTYPQNNLEIIVVDNNSTDKTKAIAKKYTPNVFNFGPERSAQRNFGMLKKAKGEYVMYLDADMILSPTVIEKAVEKLKQSNLNIPKYKIQNTKYNPSPVALYIPEIILGNSYWSRVRRFERSFYDGTVIDCVRVIRTDVFRKLNGFDETLTGPEDWDLDKRIRNEGKVSLLCRYDFKKITNEPVIFHNEADFNLKKYLFKKEYYSKSFSAYVIKWGNQDEDIKKQFGLFYRYFGVFCENKKWKKFLQYPFLTFGVFWLRFLVGLSFIISRFSFR